MTRESITALLGVLGCTPNAATSERPAPAIEPTARHEPIPTRASEPTSAAPASQVWCSATIDTRPRPLVRTRSFLLAMHELRRANVPRAAPQALDEQAARTAVCGSAQCTPTLPRAIELGEGNEFGIGTVIDVGGGELLVIPDISPYTTPSRCMNEATIAIAPLGELVHVWSDVSPRPTYVHHHDYYGSFGYYCRAPHARHDVIVDTRSDTILVDIVHGDPPLQVIPEPGEDGVLHLTLEGCATKLELHWP